MASTWSPILHDQWQWHWDNQLKSRLTGLTDEEYFWEPAPGTWSVRPAAPARAGAGAFTIDYGFPPPDPPPITTIAWRLGHVIVGVLAMRNAAHFGAPPAAYDTWAYAGTATGALTQLDEQLATWSAGVRTLDDAALLTPVGDKEPYPDLPMAALVLHIHRELIHHLSEVSLLRDLHATKGAFR